MCYSSIFVRPFFGKNIKEMREKNGFLKIRSILLKHKKTGNGSEAAARERNDGTVVQTVKSRGNCHRAQRRRRLTSDRIKMN